MRQLLHYLLCFALANIYIIYFSISWHNKNICKVIFAASSIAFRSLCLTFGSCFHLLANIDRFVIWRLKLTIHDWTQRFAIALFLPCEFFHANWNMPLILDGAKNSFINIEPLKMMRILPSFAHLFLLYLLHGKVLALNCFAGLFWHVCVSIVCLHFWPLIRSKVLTNK